MHTNSCLATDVLMCVKVFFAERVVTVSHGTVYLLNYTILAVCLFLNHLFSVLICLIL